MRTECLVVANAGVARLFTRAAPDEPLVPVVVLQHPESRGPVQALRGDHAGHGASDHRPGGTAFEPPTDLHRKEHQRFAREIATRLRSGLNDGEFASLVVLASSPFLGELKAALGDALTRVLRASADTDLTSFGVSELEKRLPAVLKEG